MDINYISILMLVVYIAVFVWQLNLINTLKSKLDVLERFQAIFDVKKVEDYVKVINKKHKQDLQNAVENKLSKEITSILEKQIGNVPDEFMQKYKEFLYAMCATLSEWTEEEIEDYLQVLPLNQDRIRHILKNYGGKNL